VTSARDLWGIAPNYTLGMETDRFIAHGRGECTDDVPCALCAVDRHKARADAAEARLARLAPGSEGHEAVVDVAVEGFCAAHYPSWHIRTEADRAALRPIWRESIRAALAAVARSLGVES
jgi:hypothetical protein